MMERLSLIIFVFFLALSGLKAQENALYTQFFYNKLAYNGAFSGAVPGVELTASAREQWMGLDGSPSVQSLQANIPFTPQRVGLGVFLRREKIGLTEHLTTNLSYAYHLRYGDYLIGLGVNARVGRLTHDFSEQNIRTTRPFGQDPLLQGNMENATYFNAGASLLIRSDRLYAGFSVPTIAKKHIELDDPDDILSSGRGRYWHLMAGYSIPMGRQMILNPQFMLSYSADIPINLDVNLLLDIGDEFIAGIGYRSMSGSTGNIGESIHLLGGIKVSDNWFMTVSYDIGLSSFRRHHNGSLEVSMSIYFGDRAKTGEMRSPRFF